MMSPAAGKNSLKARMRETVAGFCHELLHGKDAVRRDQAMSLLYETPEGKALLDIAAEHGVPIRFMRAGKVGALGSLSKDPDDATVGISVANTGNVPQMVLTLYHELRHLQQQDEQGDIRKGVFQTLKNPRRSHMLSLMQEADAFTSEAMFALNRNAAGDKKYLDSMLSRGDDVARVSARYIKKAPVSYEQDRDAFRRGLFTNIMLEGLAGYSASYFIGYAAVFRKAATRQEFADFVENLGELRKPDRQGPLISPYGESYMAQTAMTALPTIFFKALPHPEQEALRLIDKTVRALPQMTEEQYQKTREAATDALLAIYRTDPEDLAYSFEGITAREIVTEVATAQTPNLRTAFAKVATRKLQPVRSIAVRAPVPR
ncbi:MAG: hypothetical protein Q8K65_07955 [Alphaproteobacteria bacterium]|nr:hypothetical protein [Alphaproteobacteria bacterium]